MDLNMFLKDKNAKTLLKLSFSLRLYNLYFFSRSRKFHKNMDILSATLLPVNIHYFNEPFIPYFLQVSLFDTSFRLSPLLIMKPTF